jgi:hypothetical protein
LARIANASLTGALTKIAFSSSDHLTGGHWDLDLDLSSSNGKTMSAEEHYEFDSSFLANMACDKTA